MDDTWDVTEDCEQDVNEQVAATATLEEYTKRWEENGDDDFADVRSCERHFDRCGIQEFDLKNWILGIRTIDCLLLYYEG